MRTIAKLIKETKRKLKATARQIERAVGADGYRRALESAVRVCQAETHLIDVNLRAGQLSFMGEFEIWTNQQPSADLLPSVIESDVATAHGYSLGGLAATLLEVVFASLILFGFGLAWPIAIGISIVLTVLLVLVTHYAILFAAQHKSARVTLYRIKTFVLWPALALTIPAIAIVLLGRTVSGTLVIYLLPVLQTAMWIATLGLILLGSALFAASDVYRWSAKRHQVYSELVRLRILVVNTAHEYLDALGPAAKVHVPLVRPSVAAGVSLLALLLSCATAAGCGNQAGTQATPAAATAAAETGNGQPPSTPAALAEAAAAVPATVRDSVELHIELDRSGSIQREGGEAAARNIHTQLSGWIEATRATRLSISYFSTDGWMSSGPPPFELPRLQTPGIAAAKVGELKALPNIQRSIAERNERELAAAIERAKENYRSDLRRALAAVSDEMLNPVVATPAPCTDLYGVLRRAASARRGHVYVILTDGYHTCGQMKPIPPPEDGVRVLALLVAAQAKESNGQRSVDQFFDRREFLQRFAPWVQVVPVFERDLETFLRGNSSSVK